MNEPSGEMVELDFYFRNVPRAEAYRNVVTHCLKHGATFAGSILVHEGQGARARDLTSIYADSVREIRVSPHQLDERLTDSNSDVVKVALWSAIGITTNTPEIVTYSGVS